LVCDEDAYSEGEEDEANPDIDNQISRD